LRIRIGYPDPQSEAILLETHGVSEPLDALQPVASKEDVVALAARARGVYVSSQLQRYIVQIANATRNHPVVALGMSPRSGLALQRAARARAVLEGREFVSPDDVKAMVLPVVGHRLELRAVAGRGRNTVRALLEEMLHHVPVPDLPAEHRRR
jgi:MoxR-like ATPase